MGCVSTTPCQFLALWRISCLSTWHLKLIMTTSEFPIAVLWLSLHDATDCILLAVFPQWSEMWWRFERNICNSVQDYGTCVLDVQIWNAAKFLCSDVWWFGNPDNVTLEESSPKTGSFAFYQIKASSVKQADLGGMFKMTSKNVCTSNVVSPDSLSPTPSTYGAVKTWENTEESPEPADGDMISKWNTSLFGCTV